MYELVGTLLVIVVLVAGELLFVIRELAKNGELLASIKKELDKR